MMGREWSAERIGGLIDAEIRENMGQTLPPLLPEGELAVALVRNIDDGLQPASPPQTAKIVFIDGPEGTRLALRLHEAPSDAAILFIHGGGYFLGAADREDAVCQRLADEHDAAVVCVDYRLAPEHPYPAPLEDCFAALRWTAGNYEHVVVVGESAGGGLAASLSILARDSGGPLAAAQVLVYPMLDDSGTTVSSHTLAETAVWNRRLNELGWSAYLGTETAGKYAAAARVDDLEGLPPTYLEVGDLDLFRDEVIAFGARLAAASNTLELHVDPGVVHGFDRVAPDAGISKRARERRSRFIQSALAGREHEPAGASR